MPASTKESSGQAAGVWETVVEGVKSRIRGYGLGKGVRFVDREFEVEEILEGLAVAGQTTVLYGPEGCGKTELFRAIAWAVDPEEHGAAVVLIRGREGSLRVYARGRALKHLSQATGYNPFEVSGGFGFIEIERSVYSAVCWLVREAMLDNMGGARRVVLAVDTQETRDPGWLIEVLASAIEVLEDYSAETIDLSLVILAQGYAAVRAVEHLGARAGWALLWNLPRGGAEEYAEQLEIVDKVAGELGIGREEARDLLWRLAGGNPRSLEDIGRAGFNNWLGLALYRVSKVVVRLVEAWRDRPGGREIFEAFGEVSRDGVDHALAIPGIAEEFGRSGLAIQVAGVRAISRLPAEPWVGRAYAYQIPAYYYAVRAIMRENSPTPKNIVEEALRG